ncbi:hypothetical protein ACFL43_01115 [Thermodesulfobacteriota bacterium]
MANLNSVHSVFISELQKHITLAPVALKHSLPVRPLRTLGLIRLEGEVFTSEKLLRVVCLRISLPCYVQVFSTFIRPGIDYSLPVFSCEVIRLGSKRVFILDIHETGDDHAEREETDFYNGLVSLRDRYTDLLAYQKQAPGEQIQGVRSKAACQLKIPQALDDQALDILKEYITAYAGLVKDTAPMSGADLEQSRKLFEEYLTTVVDHDPGVKGNIIFFGKSEGVARALDMFFGA